MPLRAKKAKTTQQLICQWLVTHVFKKFHPPKKPFSKFVPKVTSTNLTFGEIFLSCLALQGDQF
jgi:hypothetical protein